MTFDESKVKRDKLGRFVEKDEIPEMKKDPSLFSGAGSESESNCVEQTRLNLSKEEIKQLVKDIQSLKPIKLKIRDREILAEFDKYCAEKNIYTMGRSDSDGFNFKLANINKIPEFIESSKYDHSTAEIGKTKKQHKDVKEWHYFINKIKDTKETFDMVVNIRDKGINQYVYEISFKKKRD